MGKNLLLTNLADNYDFSASRQFMANQIKTLFFYCASKTGSLPSEVLFIPYAYDGLGDFYNSYIENVKGLFFEVNFRVITEFSNPVEAIEGAHAICIGGGNLNLLKNSVSDNMYDKLFDKIENGIPYIGWNEGAVFACPTHIEDYEADETLINVVPFQIFSHFRDTFLNLTKIKTFLTNNAVRTLPIVHVVCIIDNTPFEGDEKKEEEATDEGGSGIRIEDSNAGLAETNTANVLIYQLEDGNLVSIPYDPDHLPII